jgi:hypothetical protein
MNKMDDREKNALQPKSQRSTQFIRKKLFGQKRLCLRKNRVLSILRILYQHSVKMSSLTFCTDGSVHNQKLLKTPEVKKPVTACYSREAAIYDYDSEGEPEVTSNVSFEPPINIVEEIVNFGWAK